MPTFVALTEEQSAIDRVHMALRACLLAFALLTLFSVLGERILSGFRVSVPALQIAGGLVILRVAFDLLHGERRRLTSDEREEAEEKDNLVVTPLAVPLLCGPGTMTTGIVLGAEALTVGHHVVLVLVAAAIYGLTFGSLVVAIRSARWMGPLALRVVSRLMGMLLAGVAVQFVLNGFDDAVLDPVLSALGG